MAEKSVPDWISKVIEKGLDVEQFMQLLKEVREVKEKAAEREERKADRELEKAKIDSDVKMKELDLKAREVALNESELSEKTKFKPKVTLPLFTEEDDIEVFLKSFKKLARIYKWDKSEWAVRVVPQLSSKVSRHTLECLSVLVMIMRRLNKFLQGTV